MVQGLNRRISLLAAALIPTMVIISAVDECSNFLTCSKCVESTLNCLWCYSRNMTGVSGCMSAAEDSPSKCEHLIDNPPGNITILQGDDFSNTIQVTPQKIRVELKPGQPESFTLGVRPAGDYPLDVYFLMDFSASMSDDLLNVQFLARSIASELESITGDFRIGFGSFIDKPFLPYFSIGQLNRKNEKYSFKHIVELTSDVDEFRDALRQQTTAANTDIPEGGSDAILQVLSCTDIIGWRPDARHLLVFITDAGFHFGPDGIIGGQVRRNPGICLMKPMDTPNFYEDVLTATYDYPTISQLQLLFIESNVVPIFTVTKRYLSVYKGIAQTIPGATAAELSIDSSNLLEIVKEEYRKIAQTVEITVDSVPGLSVEIKADNCGFPDPDNPAKCLQAILDSTLNFTVTLKINELTEEVKALESFLIRVVFFGDVEVEVGIVTGCECDNIKDSGPDICSANGELVCGNCECFPGNSGRDCICNSTDLLTNQKSCPVGLNKFTCSGQGTCFCGQCICDKRSDAEFYFGDACECSNFNCPKDSSGRRCGGRGTCGCNGICTCDISRVSNLPYTGILCDCSPDTDKCLDPINNKLCSGVGRCVCNQCTCNDGYTGDVCDICDSTETCTAQVCTPIAESCLSCSIKIENEKVVETGNNCSASCPIANIELVDNLPDNENTTANQGNYSCTSSLSNGGCEGITFYVVQSVDQTTVYILRDPQVCTTELAAWIIALPILIFLLLLGIFIIVIVKLCLVFLDYREYKQFKKAVANVKFNKGQNPLYTKASTEHENPLYTMMTS